MGQDEIDEFTQVVEQQNGEVGHLLDRLAEMGIGRPLYAKQRITNFTL